MKRILLVLFSVFTSFLLISTVSAVPKTSSDPLMDKIKEIEDFEKQIDEKLNDLTLDVESGGIIDLIIQIIEWLIAFVQDLIDVIGQIFRLVELVAYLISLIVKLYEFIMTLIDFILGLFNPSLLKA